jgi:hypothetical protein
MRFQVCAASSVYARICSCYVPDVKTTFRIFCRPAAGLCNGFSLNQGVNCIQIVTSPRVDENHGTCANPP